MSKYHDMLKGLALPRNVVTLDFETFYDTKEGYDLRKLSVEEYVRDPRFLAHGVGIKINNQPTRYFAGEPAVAKAMKKIPFSKALVVAQNTRFDGFIMSERYGVRAAMWSDTMQLANMVLGNTCQSASLKTLAKRFCPPELQKGGIELENVDGVLTLTPEQSQSLGSYCKQDVDITYHLYKMFTQMLADRPMEQHLLSMIIDMFCNPKLVLDADTLIQLRDNEVVEKEAALAKCVAENMTAIRSNDQFATLLEERGVEPPKKISLTTGQPTFAFAKTDREFTDLLMHENDEVRMLVKARLRIKTSINETRAMSYLAVAQRGAWPVALNMSGASTTHRLSGAADGGGNPQNLGRKSPLRAAILPPPGHYLMVADSSNIELRIAMTLAGEVDVVNRWRDDPDFDLYSTFAGYIYNVATADVTKDQRMMGKVACLALQYGSGPVTFRKTAWNWGIEITEDEAQYIVDRFRQAFPRLQRTWKQLSYVLAKLERGETTETWFDHLAKANPRTISGCPGIDVAAGLPITYPQLAWVHNARDNKRELTYQVFERQGSYGMKKPKRVKIYGSKALQNICEGLGRNIVLSQTLAINQWLKTEVHPRSTSVMSIHDEGVWVIPDETPMPTDLILDGALTIMRTSPEWWPDIPLDAEGVIGKIRYSEGK